METKPIYMSMTIQGLIPLFILIFKLAFDVELEAELFDTLIEAALWLWWVIQVILWRVRADTAIRWLSVKKKN